MQLPPRHTVISLLRETYHRLGVNSVRRLDHLIEDALEYLHTDREYFLQVVEADGFDTCPENEDRLICRLLPLAREVIVDKEEDHTRVHTAILYLMFSEKGSDLVIGYDLRRQYPDPEQNTYGFPAYRYAKPQDIRPGLQVYAPQRLRPAATRLDWEAYGMAFSALARLDKRKDAEAIALRAERAMAAAAYTEEKTLQVESASVTGKPLPLASGHTSPRQYRQDHYYTFCKELFLLLTEPMPRYLLKTTHTYQYFQKKVYDEEPGACSYEDKERRLQEEYAFISLDEIPQDMYPRY